jgi:ribosomal protein L21E
MALTKASYSMITGAVINVLDYGAIGNGVADDTSAIQAAITAAHIGGQTAGNKTVYMPAGVYVISASLALPDYCTLIGAGSFNTIIIGSMANKSFIRSQYGESPTIGQRPTGLHLRDFSIQPASIAASSVGINFKNTQYSNVENVFITQVDTGVITDQITQYCNFENVTVQVANYGGLFQGTGGGNRIIACDFGGNIIPLDFNGGVWDVFGATAEALLITTTYCVRAGRAGGASTLVQATSLYIEGTNASIISLQIENSVVQSAFKMHRHSTLGTIVNNAGDNVMIEVPGQGFYNPVYRTQRIGFASTLDGAENSSIITEGGNSVAIRNSTNTGYGSVSALDFYPSGTYAVRWTAGAGSPEGSVTASPGAMYLRNNGGAGTTLYIKETGNGNTGWVGK